MKTKSSKRYGLFIRVSSKGQREGESPAVQRKIGEEYVRSRRGTVAAIYDGVESGTKPLGERELLQRVLKDAHENKWDALWVLDQSRLTRSPDTLVAIVMVFKLNGLELHTSSGQVDLATPEGELHAGIQSSSDRYFAQKIAERTRQSRVEMLSKGKHAFGQRPFGRTWDKESEQWGIDAKEQVRILKAYRLYVEQDLGLAKVAERVGMPKSTLAKAFNSAGLTKWPRSINTPQGKQTFLLDIPALLTARQSRAVLERRARNRTIRPGAAKARSLLQGLIRCWYCGGVLSRLPSNKGDGSSYAVYRHLRTSRGKNCIGQVPAELIEDALVVACAEVVADDRTLMAALEAALTAESTGLARARARLKEIETELSELERHLIRAETELYRLSGSEAACERFRREMQRASTAIEDLRQEKATHESTLAILAKPLHKPKEIAAQIRALVGLAGIATLQLTKEQKRRLLLLVVGRDKRSSQNGIYVKVNRKFGPRKSIWFWELRGSLALVEGAAVGHSNVPRHARKADTTYEADEDLNSYGSSVLRRYTPEEGAIAKLAELTREITPLPMRSATQCS